MSSFNFTEQGNIPKTAWTADSQGMHAQIPFDFVRWSNNLVARCNPHTHFFHGAADDTGAKLTMSAAGAAREIFMCQIPAGVPPWAKSMRWTAGFSVSAGSMSAATVYTTPYAYTGPGSDDGGGNTSAFDLSNFSHGYQVRAVSASISSGNYGLVDDSATGVPTPADQSFRHDESYGTKLVTYVVVTATTSASDSTVSLLDFTCWFQP